MMAKTNIEWADVVWNPVVGCQRVSEGCRNCYAEPMARRLVAMGIHPYDGTVNARGWTGQVNEVPEWLGKPTHWKAPKVVFVNSMSDLFHPSVQVSYIANVWAVMQMEYRHTYLVLTKRPDRMQAVLTSKEFQDEYGECLDILTDHLYTADLPLDNVGLGVSIENQAAADERMPFLLRTPAAFRFVSVEPMLGPVDLTTIKDGSWYDTEGSQLYDALRGQAYWRNGDHGLSGGPTLDWVICGGESGPGARPLNLDWARSLRDQCITEDVPFFFKQWGEWLPVSQSHHLLAGKIADAPYHCWDNEPTPRSAYSVRVGKKAAGRLLDGQTWNGTPRKALTPNPSPISENGRGEKE